MVINDFEAQALAVVALDAEHREPVGGGDAHRQRLPRRARTRHRPRRRRHGPWRATPGFRSPAKAAMSISVRAPRATTRSSRISKRSRDRVSAEQILCGRGMVNLYSAIASGRRQAGRYSIAPSDITSAALRRVRYRRRRDGAALHRPISPASPATWRSIFMARGGVYLTGGITQKILPGARRQAISARPSTTRRRTATCSSRRLSMSSCMTGAARRPVRLCAHAGPLRRVDTTGRWWQKD